MYFNQFTTVVFTLWLFALTSLRANAFTTSFENPLMSSNDLVQLPNGLDSDWLEAILNDLDKSNRLEDQRLNDIIEVTSTVEPTPAIPVQTSTSVKTPFQHIHYLIRSTFFAHSSSPETNEVEAATEVQLYAYPILDIEETHQDIDSWIVNPISLLPVSPLPTEPEPEPEPAPAPKHKSGCSFSSHPFLMRTLRIAIELSLVSIVVSLFWAWRARSNRVRYYDSELPLYREFEDEDEKAVARLWMKS